MGRYCWIEVEEIGVGEKLEVGVDEDVMMRRCEEIPHFRSRGIVIWWGEKSVNEWYSDLV